MPRKKKDDEIVEVENTAEPEATAVEHDGDAIPDATAEFPAEPDGEADTSPETDPEPAPEPIPELKISDDTADEPPADNDKTPQSEPAADATESESLEESESVFAYKLDLSNAPEDGVEELDAPIVPELPDAEPEADAGEDVDADAETEADYEPLHALDALAEPEPVKSSAPQPQPVNRSAAPPRKKTIFDLKLNELDRGLSDEERDEWNAIYASFRAKSIMSGTVIGVDQNTFDVTNRETGKREKKTMYTLVIIGYRVKIIIPETELWMPGEERPSYTARAMAGAQLDFVIMEVDREGECAIASRRLALTERRRHFSRGDHREGEQLICRVTMVGAKRCSVECHGFDVHLTQRELSYTTIPDLREKYHTGQEMKCVLKVFDAKAGAFEISVKDTIPNPFDGAETRHPVGSRRQAVISGKYGGGVFCTLPDDTICLCLYSKQHADVDFRIGDGVILAIVKYDFVRQLIYGRILSKW